MNHRNSSAKDSINSERALPGDFYACNNSYYKTMLLRYGVVLELTKGEGRLLDLGSGLGWGCYLIQNYFDQVIAVDICQHALLFSKKCWSYGNVSFIRSDLLQIPLPDQSFDVISCMEVIEHIRKQDIVTVIVKKLCGY